MGGKLWKLNEDRALRNLWHSDVPSDELCAALPGRSSDAIRSRAQFIGLGARFIKWTDAEDSILRDIWSGNGSLKSHLHRLPGRTWRGALHRAKSIGLRGRNPQQFVSHFSWVEVEIVSALSQSVPMTARDIASVCQASYARITQILGRHAETKWHVVDWRHTSVSGSGNWSAVWVIGEGKNVPKPALKTKAECSKTYRVKRAIANGRIDPFGLMSASHELSGARGRVYIHLTDSKDDEFAEAA
ncbi:UNVERIFIED_ORG: hypothetical protein ABIC54_004452 [Burkholderia sp. 1263]